MFVAGPLTEEDVDRDGDRMRVHGAEGRTFDAVRGQVLNPTLRGYVADMTAPFGLAVHEDLIEDGVGHSYGEMCVPLLTGLVSEEHPAELLVLATDIPDVRYGRATATYLSWHCAGAPLAFTVCDQGPLSAFTALHLIQGYARTGGCRRAVLLVAEQPTLYHELPVPAPVPDRAAAVAVVLDTGGTGGGLSVRRHTSAGGHVRDVLAGEVAGLAGDGPAPVVLLGAHLAGMVAARDLGADVRPGTENQPFTGIWLELSLGLPGFRERGGAVLLAEYDPATGHLFSAGLRFGG